jgi:hypothetical protein
MSAKEPVMIRCDRCDGSGFTASPWPGFRVTCQQCWGRLVIEYVPCCPHEDGEIWGYGDVDDPQWDGANECGDCGALFADWPRSTP